MSKNNENKLVPKLRFPEFKMDSEWTENELGELCQYWNGASHESGVCDDGNYFLISLNSIDINGNLKDEIKKISYTDNSLKTNDMVMVLSDVAHGNFLGLTDIIPNDKYVLNQRMAGLRIKDLKEVNPQFIRYYINKSQKYFKSKGQGSSQLNLSKSAVTDFPVLKPTKLKEQQKIAACLSSLDEVITAERQKLELLKVHKKGLLQNLLPQAGETVPKFRFKEFEDSGEWKETTLTQVADYENGKAHEQDIADDGEFIVVNSKFISQDGEVKKFTNTAFLPATKGDVLMVLSDIPNGKAIAKCFLVEEDNRYTVNQRICRITPNNLNSKILYYLLNRNPYFLAFDDGVKQTNLRKEDVLNCPLMIPEDPKEQEKIADTLSSVDDLINAQNQKLEALQLHKKGLLQGLFPNVNEVTE
ncbi:Type I restriction modification DNA specificity domain protein [anaerobic digester metagenome]